jgi:hypothetical protein
MSQRSLAPCGHPWAATYTDAKGTRCLLCRIAELEAEIARLEGGV